MVLLSTVCNGDGFFGWEQKNGFIYEMLVSTGLGLFSMIGILTAQMIIEGQKGGQLSWPYVGQFLATICPRLDSLTLQI